VWLHKSFSTPPVSLTYLQASPHVLCAHHTLSAIVKLHSNIARHSHRPVTAAFFSSVDRKGNLEGRPRQRPPIFVAMEEQQLAERFRFLSPEPHFTVGILAGVQSGRAP
jgi:hypothetical protein